MLIDCTRPSKLFRYSAQKWLQRSLAYGEFRLRPASDYKIQESDSARHDDELIRIDKSPTHSVTVILESGQHIQPIGEVTYTTNVGTDYLTICFADKWDETLFEHFPETDACLVIHNVEEFCERFHAAADIALTGWTGVDASIMYGKQSPLGAVFSKPLQFSNQNEFRFAWRPMEPKQVIESVLIQMGSIADIAEIVNRP